MLTEHEKQWIERKWPEKPCPYCNKPLGDDFFECAAIARTMIIDRATGAYRQDMLWACHIQCFVDWSDWAAKQAALSKVPRGGLF